MANEPVQLNPSAPGQEPLMAGPPTPSSSDDDGANNIGNGTDANASSSENNRVDDAVPNPNSTPSAAGRPRPRGQLRFHFNSRSGGQISINGQTINLNRSSGANVNRGTAGVSTSNPNNNNQNDNPQPTRVARGSFGRAIHRGIQRQAQRAAQSNATTNNNSAAQSNRNANSTNANENTNSNGNNGQNQQQQPRRINISGRFRVNGNAQVNNSNNSGRPTPMQVMGAAGPMLPPLEPQPVPNQTSDGHGSDNAAAAVESGDKGKSTDVVMDMKKFECAICFEYMDCPVGCGSSTCQTRYCHSCLNRVYRQETSNRNPQSTDPSNSAKCPNCRSFFTLQSMEIDGELRKQIQDCTDTVTCPFKGCGKELRIGLLKSHEANCPYIRMRCRYAEWGCDWVGRKKDMADHDEHECEFKGGLGKLVERFRQNDAQVGHLLQQHHMQIAGHSQMMALQSRQMMMMRSRNAGSVLDVMQLTYELCLFPGRYAATKEMWSSLTGQPARFAVCNMMLMIPSLLVVFHVALHGFKSLSNLQHQSLSDDDFWWVVDTLLLSVITSLLGLLSIVCFYVDSKGPLDWTIYNIRDIIPGQPILRDLAAVCMAMMHFCSIEFSGMYIGILHWHFVAILTCFFPSFTNFIIEKNDSTTGRKTLTSARAWPVVVFGLRYGLLVSMCGISPSVNALIIIRCFERYLQKTGIGRKLTAAGKITDCFIKQLGTTYLIVIAGLCTVVDHADLEVSFVDTLLDSVFAAIALAYINLLVYLLAKAGVRLGESNFQSGNNIFMQAHRASGAVLPNIHPSPIGCGVYICCSFLLACIAIA